ncbi:MAG: hypothetical protein RDU89_10275 [bacterium]|nr:hypothetical protein [bacterium]
MDPAESDASAGSLRAHLHPLGDSGCVIRGEVLIPYGRRLFFAIAEPHRWRKEGGVWRVPFLGLGGHRPPGEEVRAGLPQAIQEETGLAVRLVDSPFSLYFGLDGEGRTLPLDPSLRPRPCYVWKSFRQLVASFRAEPVDPSRPPAPGHKVRALIGLYASQLLAMGDRGADLQPLLADGAVLEGADLPRQTVAYPWGTPRYLGRYLETLARRRE